MTLSIKGQNQSIDQMVTAACSTSEVVNDVHCVKCWLSQLKTLASDLDSSLKTQFLEKIKELEDLPGCDYDEASEFRLTQDHLLKKSFLMIHLFSPCCKRLQKERRPSLQEFTKCL